MPSCDLQQDQLIRSYGERLSDQDTRCSSAEQKLRYSKNIVGTHLFVASLSEMKNLLEEQKKRCAALEKDLNVSKCCCVVCVSS